MENLKFMIEELNVIFSNDYNCFTFNNLTGDELLQVILDVMLHLGILEKSEIRDNPCAEILRKLDSIRYSDKPVEELKAGLQEGKRDTLHAVLMFLLRNQANVITRNYLSKYANRVEIPAAIKQDDAKLAHLEKQYAALIEEFWNAYSGDKLAKSWASEAKELEDDIWQMRLDTGNLGKRLNLQKGKLGGVGEEEMAVIGAYCAEEKRNAKLVKQLEEEKRSLEDLNELHLFYMKRKNVASLEDFLENVEMNKQNHSLIGCLCEDLKTDVSLMKRVAEEEKHPDSAEIEHLQQSVYHMQNSLRELKVKAGETFTRDRVLRKKKDLISKQVLKLQAKNDSLIGKIGQYLSLLGGDVLSGKSLKEYVAKLRHVSLVYKGFKKKLNGLESEVGVLKKTLDVLCGLDEGVRRKIEGNRFNYQNKNSEVQDKITKEEWNKNQITNDNSSEPITKYKYATKFTEFTALKSDFIQIKTEHDVLSKTHKNTINAFEENKHNFEKRAGDLIAQVSSLEIQYQDLNESIQTELNQLNQYVEQAEDFKDRLLRYSQYFIENTDSISFLEALEGNMKTLQEENGKLKKAAENRNARIEGVKGEIAAIKGVKELVMLKFDSQLYD